MDLIGAQGDQTFNSFAWLDLLQLAVEHGWQPAGVLPPDEDAVCCDEDDELDDEDDELNQASEFDVIEDPEEGADEEDDADEENDQPVTDDSAEPDPVVSTLVPPLTLDQLSPAARRDLEIMNRKSEWFRSIPHLLSYQYNDGCRVSAEDAHQLADALERALPDIPNHDAMEHKTIQFGSDPADRAIPCGTEYTPAEYFSGTGKAMLRDFIEFCRQGGFEIW